MSRVTIPRTKADVERDYHGQAWDSDGMRREVPMLNVKVHAWWDDVRKYATEGHEFSGDTEFWEWAEAHERDCNHGENCPFNRAWELACEDGWERAVEAANSFDDEEDTGLMPGRTVGDWHSPRNSLHLYQEGRSGGWLVIAGLPPIRDWDAVMLARWRRFAKRIDSLVDDTPYLWVWHLYVQFYEPVADKREIERTDDAAALLPVLMGV